MVKMTDDELKENTEENPTCRRCTKKLIVFNDIREHSNDEDYFDRDDVPIWERRAYQILENAEDTPILIQLLDMMMKDDNMKIEDYCKIIEVMASAFVHAQYDENLQELPK
jgi:hypothetical protein